MLRTNMQYVEVDTDKLVFAVTSSLPDEGKSTVAVNLALALALAKQRVVLVECDLRRPQLARRLGLDGSTGTTTVLIGKAGMEDALQVYDVDRAPRPRLRPCAAQPLRAAPVGGHGEAPQRAARPLRRRDPRRSPAAARHRRRPPRRRGRRRARGGPARPDHGRPAHPLPRAPRRRGRQAARRGDQPGAGQEVRGRLRVRVRLRRATRCPSATSQPPREQAGRRRGTRKRRS